MGNNIENFCNCENNDSRFEASLRTAPNQNSERFLCPFVQTVIYQNYNIDNKSHKGIRGKNKLKDKFDYEMNFEYHSNTKSGKEFNTTKGAKGIFNLNPSYNNNDINDNINNNIDDNYKFMEDNNNNNEDDKNFINIEEEEKNQNNNNINNIDNYENEMINEQNNNNISNKINEDNIINNKEIEEEEENNIKNKKNIVPKLKMKDIKKNEAFSENSDNSDAPTTNIEKPKLTPKNGVDIQFWNKNLYNFGYFHDNVLEGWGKMISGENKYCGEFKNDQANGYGIYYKNGTDVIYEGCWVNDLQDKYGIEKWSDGSAFYGEYKKQNKNGIGIYMWKDGSRYEGEFKNNMFDGYGIYFYNKNKIYLGQWKSNKKHGYGEFILEDKLYVGDYNMDFRDGFGINYWKNDDKLFVGFWKNNRRYGFGKLFSEKKMRYGLWYEDKKKTKFFEDEKEAKDYMEKNGLNNYKKFFEYSKDELVNFYKIYFNEDFIQICTLSENLIK